MLLSLAPRSLSLGVRETLWLHFPRPLSEDPTERGTSKNVNSMRLMRLLSRLGNVGVRLVAHYWSVSHRFLAFILSSCPNVDCSLSCSRERAFIGRPLSNAVVPGVCLRRPEDIR